MTAKSTLHQSINAAFRFVISLDDNNVAAFTECRLPAIELELETVKEGGLNTYVHQLPGMRKPETIVLINGIGLGTIFDEWRDEILLNSKFSRKMVTLELRDEKNGAVIQFFIKDAFPYKWSFAPLQSSSNTIAIQTLYLACGEISKA